MSNPVDRLRALASELDSLADSLTLSPYGGGVTLADFLRTRVPAVITSSKAASGPWWTYITMPKGWVPKSGQQWVHDESRDYYWFDRAGATKEESIKNALIDLIERTFS